MTATNILKSVLKSIPAQWAIPALIDYIVNTIKNPNSQDAQAIKPALLELASDINAKFGQQGQQ